MATPALQTLNSVLKNKDISVLYGNSVDDLFAESGYGDVWDSVKAYHAKYHSIPDIEVIQERFPDLEEVPVKGETEYYLEQFKEEFIRTKIERILLQASREINSDTGPRLLANMQSALNKLNRFSDSAKDMNIMDFDDAERHYKEVRERAEAMGGTPGIPTGISFIDSAYTSGLAGGDLVIVLGWAQPHSEPILTPAGWVTMGSLATGDYVIGSSGQPVRVLETHERGKRQVVRVGFSDGTFVLCDKDHLWEVQTAKMRQRGIGTKTVSTSELLSGGVLFNRTDDRINYKYFMPLPAPVAGTELDTVVGPYLMGQLLSDGCTVGGSVYLTTNDEQAISIIREENPHISVEERTYEGSTARRWLIRGGYRSLKIERGLYAHEKSIPAEYMLATPSERLALLRGLMDGDGSVTTGRKAEFMTTSTRLADDVAGLVRSLGGVAKIRNVSREYKSGNGRIVSIWLPVSPFGIDRKADKYAPAQGGYKAISSVEYLDYFEPMKCIKVDAPDSLYVTRHYTLTHNTGRAKSQFTTLVACNAHEKGYRPMITSLEMSGEKVRDRIFTIKGSGMFRQSSLTLGDVSTDDFRSFRQKNENKNAFYVVTNDGIGELTPNVMQAKIDQHKPDLLIFDYAQLATDNANSQDMTARMRNMSKEYKRLAVNNDIPVVLISSATAESSSAASEPPTVEQVAWSKQLAFDADLAFAVHKHDDSNIVEIVCRKNRNGPLFSGFLDWDIDQGIIKEKFDL